MIKIIPAENCDLLYIDDLQKKNAEELAFYPKTAFEREIQNRRILIAKINNAPAGYLYHGAFREKLKIHQACIQYDVRGFLYGSQLVRFLIQLAEKFQCLSITLRCGSDINANKFWEAMGFYCEGITKGGVRRMRDINCWRFDLQKPLFITEVNPSSKKANSSIWRKSKNNNQNLNGGKRFLRGRGMKLYRQSLEENYENHS
tara:strand:+ start:134 stop:739 length:606 start_codon:yes stop_codon:yes gene_type:complete